MARSRASRIRKFLDNAQGHLDAAVDLQGGGGEAWKPAWNAHVHCDQARTNIEKAARILPQSGEDAGRQLRGRLTEIEQLHDEICRRYVPPTKRIGRKMPLRTPVGYDYTDMD